MTRIKSLASSYLYLLVARPSCPGISPSKRSTKQINQFRNMAAHPESYFFEQTEFAPNSKLPVLVYRGVLPIPYDEETTTQHVEKNSWLKG